MNVVTHVSGVLRFTVPGVPVPAARPRASVLMRNGKPVIAKKTGRPVIHTFMPDKTTDYEKHVAVCAQSAARAMDWPYPPTKSRIGLVIRIFRAANRGDLDNYEKAIMDGITKSEQVWPDDRYVVSKNSAMCVSKKNPRVEVEVRIL